MATPSWRDVPSVCLYTWSKEPPPTLERHQIDDRSDNPHALNTAQMATVLAQNGQPLLPILDLIENAQNALDDLIDVMGRATIEAVLLMSAEGVAGPKHQGTHETRARCRTSRRRLLLRLGGAGS